MTIEFPVRPDNPVYAGFDAPSGVEAEIQDLQVEGTIPEDLDGTFFRVGPDPLFPPRTDRFIFFDDDGMVCSFRFKKGHVDLISKYAQTDKYKAEKKAGRALVGEYRNPFTDDPSIKGMIRGTANTNVVVHHGKLLALKEDSPPLEMCPKTLDTIGNYDFGGKMTSNAFTAHPKVDPKTGQMLAFGYSAKGVGTHDMVYYEINSGGEITHETWFKSPRSAMVHDFAITDNFVVFPISSLVSDVERLKEDKPAFHWLPDVEQIYGVLPRGGSAEDLRWFTYPKNAFQGHVLNAWDEEDKIFLDMTLASDNVFAFFPEDGKAPPNGMDINNEVVRWTFDLQSSSSSPDVEVLFSFAAELPYIDQRYVGQPYQHAFLTLIDFTVPYDFEKCGPPSFNAPLCGLVHLNVATGDVQRWLPGPTSSVQEPVFAPRSPDAREGDGYVIALVNRLTENRNDLVILDALRLDEGPIATVKIPIRIRPGLHGNWVSAANIA